MRIIFLLLITTCIALSVRAEVPYDDANANHLADKNCIAAISILRDVLYDDVEIINNKVWIKRIEPTADIVKARKSLVEKQNQLILKYAYSRELNAQVKDQKQKYQTSLFSGSTSDVESLIQKCL